MNYNFTDSVRSALLWAREEAIRLSHDYLGTEHILLGVLRVEGVAERFGIDAGAVRERVEASVRPGRGMTRAGELPFTSRAKKVLELAMAEARALAHSYVGTEHLVLGLVREQKGIAGQVLSSVGVELDEARNVARERDAGNRGTGARGRAAQKGGKFKWSREFKVLAQTAMSQASVLRHDYVGTAHLLLVLAANEELMTRFGLRARAVRDAVGRSLRPGEPDAEAYSLSAKTGGSRRGGIPLSTAAMSAFEHAADEAERLGSEPRSEHLLLGLLSQEEGTAGKVLAPLGLDLAVARRIAASEEEAVRRAESATGFRIVIDEQSESASIYQQIVDQVREAVATGQLEPGRRLPTVRALADELDIAPGTVARAYAELERLGVVVTEGARGTRVAEPKRTDQSPAERLETLSGLLRPVAVAAFHMGGSAAELRQALDAAMQGIMDGEASVNDETTA